MPEEVQRVVGEPPEGYYAYWAKDADWQYR